MNKLKLMIGGALLIVAMGCTSTLTVGSKANKNGLVGASVSTTEASVTLPFVKAEAKHP